MLEKIAPENFVILHYGAISEHGKRYAKEMLRQNLLRTKQLNISRVMIIYDYNNHANEKTILANGGVLDGEIHSRENDLFIFLL